MTQQQSHDKRGGGQALRTLMFVAALGVGLALVLKNPSGPDVGQSAADFELPHADGSSRLRLSDLRGSPVVLEVFASWCTACRSAAPTMRRAALQRRARDVHFVGVSVDSDRGAAAALKKDWGIPFPVLHDDGAVASKYRVQVLPTVIVLDDAGKVVRVASGSPSGQTLEDWLAEVGAARM